jgi:hypothetical protein
LLSITVFAVATLVALWNPEVALLMYGIFVLSYLLPGEWLNRLLVPELRASEPEGGTHKAPILAIDPTFPTGFGRYTADLGRANPSEIRASRHSSTNPWPDFVKHVCHEDVYVPWVLIGRPGRRI